MKYSCQSLIRLEVFSTDFRQTIEYQNFTKSRPVGAEFIHANRHDEANGRFSQFSECSNKSPSWYKTSSQNRPRRPKGEEYVSSTLTVTSALDGGW